MQVYAAQTAFMLVRLLRQTFAALDVLTGRARMARIAVCLLDRLDLTGRSKPPPQGPASQPPSPQLALAWSEKGDPLSTIPDSSERL